MSSDGERMSEIWFHQRTRVLFLLALSLIALVIQVLLFKRQSLWADEIFSLAMATGHSLEHPARKADPARGDFVQGGTARPAAEWQQYLQHEKPAAGIRRVVRAVSLSDTSPPLYYVFLYEWTRVFGVSDAALRSFSVLCSLLCLPLIVALSNCVGPGSLGPIATTLFVFSPSVVYYFAEGRMYSLLWLATLAAAWLTTRLRREESGLVTLAAWSIVAAAGLLVHYFFVFPWAAMIVFLLLRPGGCGRGKLIVGCLVAALAVLPWYMNLRASLNEWRITGDWLTLEPSGFSRLAATRDFALQFFSGRALSLWPTPRWAIVVALLVIASAALYAGVRLRWRALAGDRLLLWLWLAAAVAGPVVFDFLRGTYVVAISRYGLPGAPAACILMAGAFAAMRGRWRMGLVTLLVAVWCISIAGMYRWRWRSGAATREVARAVAGRANSEDVVLVHSIPSGLLGVARYADPAAKIASWVGQLAPGRAPESVVSLIAGSSRVRFVRIHDVGAPAVEEKWLRDHATVEKEHRFGDARVIDFRPKEGNQF
jgi:hypothetical protein